MAIRRTGYARIEGAGERNPRRWVLREQGSLRVGPARPGAGGIQPADGWTGVLGQDAQSRGCRGAEAHAEVQKRSFCRTGRSPDLQVRLRLRLRDIQTRRLPPLDAPAAPPRDHRRSV